jgi:hypothetical protein
MMASETRPKQPGASPREVQLPAPTSWPIVLAFGLTLVFAGFVTSFTVTLLGAVLTIAGTVGWFRELYPHEHHELEPAEERPLEVATTRPEVARLEPIPDLHRARVPIEIYPVSAGVKGGLAGGVAMALLAMLYGVVSGYGIWYPINLLAAIVYAEPLQVTTRQMSSFHIELFLVASAIHLVSSLLVGLLYGAVLPMFPRRPILLGGFVAPVVWSGLLHSVLGIINPLLDQRIHWGWFLASQIGFGITAGLVVARQGRIRTRQYLPFAVRAGLEMPGVMNEKAGKGSHQ